MISQISELIEFSSDAAFVIDVDARVVAWNKPAERLLGYSPSETLGLHCGDVLQASLPGGQPLCHSDCDLLRCFRECRPYGVPNCKVRHRDGGWLTASIATIAMSERTRRIYAEKVMAVIFIRDGAPVKPIPQHHRLQVFTLGCFAIAVAGYGVDLGKWKRKQAVALLRYLVTQAARPVRRERLLDFLWPDAEESQARGRLKVVLYDLRRELRVNGITDVVVKTDGETYQLQRDVVWVDSDAFERLITEGRMHQERMQWCDALERYDEARDLYRGDYLEEEAFPDWCLEKRERLHGLYFEMLARTAQCHAELSQYAEAVNICHKALILDPCLENFHFALMQYLVSNGYPELALAQYRSCVKFLARGLDTAPSPKTRNLYKQILKGGDDAHLPGNPRQPVS